MVYNGEQFLLYFESRVLRRWYERRRKMSTADLFSSERVLEEGLSVLRTLRVPNGEIALVAVN